jgi:anti-sigma regulatory factor (Ser/Thr protein kinase)
MKRRLFTRSSKYPDFWGISGIFDDMKKNVRTIVVQTPGDMSYLYRIREFITGIAIESGIDQQDIDNIELAIDEACTNVIEHGYDPNEPNKDITIRMEITTSKLVLTIIDHAKPFNILRYKPRDIRELQEEGKDGGLGIRLLRGIMDVIDYRTTANGYNELIMIKYFKSANQDHEISS